MNRDDRPNDHPLTPEEQEWMASVPDRIDPPAGLRGAVVNRLADEGLLLRRSDRPRHRRLALAASIALAFVAGGAVGALGTMTTNPGERTMADESLPQFLLLLYEDQSYDPEDRTEAEIVEEYGAWAGALAEAGQLVSAEKLTLDGRIVATGGVGSEGTVSWQHPQMTAPVGAIGGFFLVRAADYEEAEEIAAASPHVRYGGRIVVRRVDPT